MRGISGLLMIGIGILHTAFGIFQGYRLTAQIARATFSNPVGRQVVIGLGRQYLLWFLFTGVLMLILGHVLMWIERRLNHPLPSFVGWELLGFALVGVILQPVSGFWLILPLAIYILIAARRATQLAGAPA
jgi:hypothetical protein